MKRDTPAVTLSDEIKIKQVRERMRRLSGYSQEDQDQAFADAERLSNEHRLAHDAALSLLARSSTPDAPDFEEIQRACRRLDAAELALNAANERARVILEARREAGSRVLMEPTTVYVESDPDGRAS